MRLIDHAERRPHQDNLRVGAAAAGQVY